MLSIPEECILHPVDALEDLCALKGESISRVEGRECFPATRVSSGRDEVILGIGQMRSRIDVPIPLKYMHNYNIPTSSYFSLTKNSMINFISI